MKLKHSELVAIQEACRKYEGNDLLEQLDTLAHRFGAGRAEDFVSVLVEQLLEVENSP